MATSTRQELRSQAVLVSAGEPDPTLHGVAVLQNFTLVTGAAAAGPKVGTASGPLDVGEVLGLDFADAFGVGDAAAVPPFDALRFLTMITPPPPTSRISTAAIAAGINQAGRSIGSRAAGLRATVGLRAGALSGDPVAVDVEYPDEGAGDAGVQAGLSIAVQDGRAAESDAGAAGTAGAGVAAIGVAGLGV